MSVLRQHGGTSKEQHAQFRAVRLPPFARVISPLPSTCNVLYLKYAHEIVIASSSFRGRRTKQFGGGVYPAARRRGEPAEPIGPRNDIRSGLRTHQNARGKQGRGTLPAGETPHFTRGDRPRDRAPSHEQGVQRGVPLCRRVWEVSSQFRLFSSPSPHAERGTEGVR